MATITKSVRPLTQRQLEIWRFMLRYQERHHGMPPMMKTIADACGIGTATGVQGHIKRLTRKGKAAREHRRYIAIPDPSPKDHANGAKVKA